MKFLLRLSTLQSRFTSAKCNTDRVLGTHNQTTNLGVGGSNPSGRARISFYVKSLGKFKFMGSQADASRKHSVSTRTNFAPSRR